jgi:ubiquinone biosynthesis protein COQ4
MQAYSRPPPLYDGHVPLSRTEKTLLAFGSAFMSLYNPWRGGTHSPRNQLTLKDMVAALGEATAGPFIHKLRDTMLSDPTGRRILREKPRIRSTTLDIEKLRQLPENTIGREYVRWLEIEGVSPDTRAAVPLDFFIVDI